MIAKIRKDHHGALKAAKRQIGLPFLASGPTGVIIYSAMRHDSLFGKHHDLPWRLELMLL